MVSSFRTVSAVLVACAVTGCAGRFTGGGAVYGGEGGSSVGQVTLNNISAADCNGDGTADTVRGSFNWKGADGVTFTCGLTRNEYAQGGNFIGIGIYSGTVTKAGKGVTANYCAAIVAPALGTYAVGVCYGSNSDQCTFDVEGLGEDPTTWVFSGGTGKFGILVDGNVSYHKENTKGVCSSNGTTPG